MTSIVTASPFTPRRKAFDQKAHAYSLGEKSFEQDALGWDDEPAVNPYKRTSLEFAWYLGYRDAEAVHLLKAALRSKRFSLAIRVKAFLRRTGNSPHEKCRWWPSEKGTEKVNLKVLSSLRCF
jgi:hypothetical protein